MKKTILIHSTIVALALPLAAIAQDKTDPGKSGDAVKNPPATPSRPSEPLRTPDKTEREPGKASDAVKETNPAAAAVQFAGAITAVNRDEKTVTIADTTKGAHKLKIAETTKIKRGDKTATWDDLKVGVMVDGTCRGTPDNAHAETLNIKL